MRFIQARNYTRTSGRAIDVIVIHTMEAPEKPDTAENIARWFAGPTAPRASAHYCIDNNSIVQGVRDQDVAWAAPGCNHNGLQLEHAGYARQRPRDWQDEYSKAMLRLSAGLSSRLCRKHSIPVRWLSAADLKAGRRGITSHANVSAAFRKSSHWDPGAGFPVTDYLRMVKENLPQPKPVKEPLDVVEDLLRQSNDYKRGNRRVTEALRRLRAWRKSRKV